MFPMRKGVGEDAGISEIFFEFLSNSFDTESIPQLRKISTESTSQLGICISNFSTIKKREAFILFDMQNTRALTGLALS